MGGDFPSVACDINRVCASYPHRLWTSPGCDGDVDYVGVDVAGHALPRRVAAKRRIGLIRNRLLAGLVLSLPIMFSPMFARAAAPATGDNGAGGTGVSEKSVTGGGGARGASEPYPS